MALKLLTMLIGLLSYSDFFTQHTLNLTDKRQQKKCTIGKCNDHDITSLRSWGPYSKRYAGISHIPDINKGIRFDFSVMPGYYRNRQLVPHVLFESSYYPWEVNPEMTHITYRYELEWKDKVYTDVTYSILDDNRTLVGVHCVNHTNIPQNLVLNQMAYIDYPESQPEVAASDASHLQWYNAVDYVENEPFYKSPQYRLVYDGLKRNEERSSMALGGSILGKGFGRNKGDRVSYLVNILPGQEEGAIKMRFKVDKKEVASFYLKGLIEQSVELKGTGEYDFLSVPYFCEKPGWYRLEFISNGGAGISLNGFFVGNSQDIGKVNVVRDPIAFTPEMEVGKTQKDFMLKYKDCDNFYGVAWNYPHSVIREILNGELESFFRKKVHDHVSSELVGDRKWHYANAFLRPIVLEPNSEQTVYMLVCTGKKEQVQSDLLNFHSDPDRFITQAHTRERLINECKALPGGDKYLFGKRMLQAALLSNIVYPVYTQREYIRHFTPGKNWNSLYTWDSGFIALGLIDIDPVKAFECIKAYTTPAGSESAFIHHGTPLPIQMYAYLDLWNNGLSRDTLAFLYPRLKQFFDFMTGENGSSSTRMKGSGLLRTWDYFYNSGGWDDYPPQSALNENKQQSKFITPVVASAYYLRAAKILRLVAKELGLKRDIMEYDQVISRLSTALKANAWDEESGYFGYVVHDSLEYAKSIFRCKDRSNFNKGLDGVTPLAAGICTPDQINKMVKHLFSPDELWTKIGLSTVDQSASYYKEDGYWNGAVWFPHQWIIWKALLDLGKGKEAYKIAHTALDLWEKECEDSYFTFEHFIISSGRGAGWHQFSGLSSPILNWFAAYYKQGKISTGFEVWIKQNGFNDDCSEYQADVAFDDSTKPHERCMIVCLNPKYTYKAFFNGRSLILRSQHAGQLEVTLPATNKAGKLVVKAIN